MSPLRRSFAFGAVESQKPFISQPLLRDSLKADLLLESHRMFPCRIYFEAYLYGNKQR